MQRTHRQREYIDTWGLWHEISGQVFAVVQTARQYQIIIVALCWKKNKACLFINHVNPINNIIKLDGQVKTVYTDHNHGTGIYVKRLPVISKPWLVELISTGHQVHG